MRASKRTTIALSAIALTLTGLTIPPATAAVSTGAVIAEVYGGGGNSGATLTQDFVELANRGADPVTLDGWSVQYLPAAPTSGSTWQVTPLNDSVEPAKRYLVAEARGAAGTVELPAPDATGTIAMSATQGTIALVNSTTALTCKTASDCALDTRIVDLVGYGNAAVHETAPAPAASNTTSVARGVSLADTDSNASDFAAGTPSPENSGSGGEPDPDPTSIAQIQGTKRVSPLDDQPVVGVEGVVTAIRAFGSARGFWFQDATPDDDPRTSEGLFVFTGSTTPAVKVGDAVTAKGTVQDFYPSNPATSPHQSTTELTGAQWTVNSSGNPLPAPEEIKPDTVPAKLTAKPGGNIEPLELDPAQYALDFWESREGMRVGVTDVRIVGPTTSFNELYVTSKPDEFASVRGGALYSGYDADPTGVFKIESLIPFSQRPFPKSNTGDTLSGATAGVVEYDQFGGYTLMATELGQVTDNGLQREVTRKQADGELAVATYNVENLDPTDAQSKFDALAHGIVDNLSSPDIVVLEEVQDNNGAAGTDGVVAADQTLKKFTEAITAAGGPAYEARQIDPEEGQDGGQPGGNIRVGFLFNPERVEFVDRPGGDATTPVDVIAKDGSKGKPQLTISPGRIDPTNDAFEDSRKPLAGEFKFHGRTVFVVANHFSSKGGDQPVHGRFQPPNRTSEVQRLAQATAVRAFVDDVLQIDRNASVVVAGDINDFQFSPTIGKLTEGGALTALISTLPANEQYGYVFEGKSQVLDHILTSAGAKVAEFDVVHVNAEFHDQNSDHDPAVVRLKPGKS